ncbi:MAG: hypothetical protein ACPG47_02115 [Leucothrix sp.]
MNEPLKLLLSSIVNKESKSMHEIHFLKGLKNYITEEYGNQYKAAKHWGITPTFLSLILSGKRGVPDVILEDLGYTKKVVVQYIKPGIDYYTGKVVSDGPELDDKKYRLCREIINSLEGRNTNVVEVARAIGASESQVYNIVRENIHLVSLLWLEIAAMRIRGLI